MAVGQPYENHVAVTGSTHFGSSFLGELTSVETGTSCIFSAGKGFKRGVTAAGPCCFLLSHAS